MRKILLASVFAVAAHASQAQEAMTEAEKLDFWDQVAQCYLPPEGTYNIGITVRFELDRDGRIVDNLVEIVGPTSDTDEQMRNLYEAARAAIVRCGRRGFDLPASKYVYWQDIQMTFRAPVRRLDQLGETAD